MGTKAIACAVRLKTQGAGTENDVLLSCLAQVAGIEDSEDFSVVSTSSDERVWIVTFTKSDLPSTSYMYNRSVCCHLLVVCCCFVCLDAKLCQHASTAALTGPLRIMLWRRCHRGVQLCICAWLGLQRCFQPGAPIIYPA